LLQIPAWIKERVGFASFFPATVMVMPENGCPQIFQVRIGVQIIGGIKCP